MQFIFQPNFQTKFKTTVHLSLPVQKVIDMPERPRKGKPTKTIVCKPAQLPPSTHVSCHRNMCVCLSAITKPWKALINVHADTMISPPSPACLQVQNAMALWGLIVAGPRLYSDELEAKRERPFCGWGTKLKSVCP